MSTIKGSVLGVAIAFAATAFQPAEALDIETVRVTSGHGSFSAYLALDSAGRAHISYNNDPWQGFWAYALGYAVIDTNLPAIESQDDDLISFNHCGEAQILSNPDGGQILFHHRWFPLEDYSFVAIDSSGQVASDVKMTNSGGCANTDSDAGAVNFGDGTFGLVYTSCRGTGMDESERNNLWYTRWSAGGTRITDDLILDDSAAVGQGSVSATVDDNDRVHIVYLDHSTGGLEVYYQRTDANGVSQVGRTLVETNPGPTGTPDIAVDAIQGLQLVWAGTDEFGTYVYKMPLTDAGVPLAPPTQVSMMGNARTPMVETDSDNATHLVWTETIGDSTGAYYTKLDSDGTPLIPSTQLTEASVRARSFAVGPEGIVHVSWTTGNGSGPGDIYYARVQESPSSVDLPQDAAALQLRVRPNPIRGATRLAFDLPEAGRVRLAVYDAGGREVRTLVSGELGSGRHSYTWDGNGERRAAAGIYFARLFVDGRSMVETKLTLLPR